MKKNIIIAILFGLLVMTGTITIVGAQVVDTPGNKPDAVVKPSTVTGPANTHVVRDGTASDLIVTEQFTVALTSPVTGLMLRELPIKASVNLASQTTKSQGLELFMVDGKNKLKNAIKAAAVSITDPKIEKWDVLTDANGDVQSIPMQINARVAVGSFYSERVRFEIEGLNYTDLDPYSTNVNTMFEDIEANTLAAFSK